MMRFDMDEASLQEAGDHLEATRQNILAGIRSGMTEGMEGLANAVAEKLHGNPIGERTGDLLAAVLSSPRIVETERYIKGEVSTSSAKYRNLGIWLEFGTKYPTKGRNLGSYPRQFLHSFKSANADSIRKHGHGAFRIEPRPFFNPTFDNYYPTILDVINQRIAEAASE